MNLHKHLHCFTVRSEGKEKKRKGGKRRRDGKWVVEEQLGLFSPEPRSHASCTDWNPTEASIETRRNSTGAGADGTHDGKSGYSPANRNTTTKSCIFSRPIWGIAGHSINLRSPGGSILCKEHQRHFSRVRSTRLESRDLPRTRWRHDRFAAFSYASHAMSQFWRWNCPE